MGILGYADLGGRLAHRVASAMTALRYLASRRTPCVIYTSPHPVRSAGHAHARRPRTAVGPRARPSRRAEP